MGRKPNPRYDADRREWYTRIRRLGPEKKSAEKRFHELMAAAEEAAASPSPEILAGEVADRLLQWCYQSRAKRTAEWYEMHLQSFFDWAPDAKRLGLRDLKPVHVYGWANAHSSWSASFKRGGIVAVRREFKWAVEAGLIAHNPLPC